MSTPAIEAAGVHADAGAAAQNLEDHTPSAPPVVPDETPDPPQPVDGLAALTEIVTRQGQMIADLTSAFKAMSAPDDTPRPVPWTHKGR